MTIGAIGSSAPGIGAASTGGAGAGGGSGRRLAAVTCCEGGPKIEASPTEGVVGVGRRTGGVPGAEAATGCMSTG